MKNIKEILTSYSITKETRHSYGQFYDKHFSLYQNTAKKVLEIGVDTGISIYAWLDYFPSATIYGMDIVLPNDPRLFNDRVILFTGDQGDINSLNEFIKTYGGDFDIIIDDGGHTMQQQQLTFKTYFPFLKSGGMYVIEDLHTSYLSGYTEYGQLNTPVTTLDLVKHLEKDLITKTFSTEFISIKEMNDLKMQIEYCKVEKDPSTPGDELNNSEISFIKKK